MSLNYVAILAELDQQIASLTAARDAIAPLTGTPQAEPACVPSPRAATPRAVKAPTKETPTATRAPRGVRSGKAGVCSDDTDALKHKVAGWLREHVGDHTTREVATGLRIAGKDGYMSVWRVLQLLVVDGVITRDGTRYRIVRPQTEAA